MRGVLITFEGVEGSGKTTQMIRLAHWLKRQGYRVERTEDLVPILQKALGDDTVSIVDCPVDYSENMKLTRKLETLASPI